MQASALRLTHSCISLGDTTTHTTQETSGCGADTHANTSGLYFRSGEKKYTTLSGGFNPSLFIESAWIECLDIHEVTTDPRNQTLIHPGDTTTGPDCLGGLEHSL